MRDMVSNTCMVHGTPYVRYHGFIARPIRTAPPLKAAAMNVQLVLWLPILREGSEGRDLQHFLKSTLNLIGCCSITEGDG